MQYLVHIFLSNEHLLRYLLSKLDEEAMIPKTYSGTTGGRLMECEILHYFRSSLFLSQTSEIQNSSLLRVPSLTKTSAASLPERSKWAFTQWMATGKLQFSMMVLVLETSSWLVLWWLIAVMVACLSVGVQVHVVAFPSLVVEDPSSYRWLRLKDCCGIVKAAWLLFHDDIFEAQDEACIRLFVQLEAVYIHAPGVLLVTGGASPFPARNKTN